MPNNTVNIKEMHELLNPEAAPAQQVKELFYPKTHEAAVVDSDGNTLESKLAAINEDVAEAIEAGVEEINGIIDTAEDSLADIVANTAIRTDEAQTLTDSEKAQAMANMGVDEELALGAVYDVSAKHPTAGPNSDGKFTLEYVLSNADTLIPSGVRKGGMSIKFVQSSDNKYVQARCMAQNFTTDVTQWQGIDDTIIENSRNVAESGAVFECVNEVKEEIDGTTTRESISTTYTNKYVNCSTAVVGNAYIGVFTDSQTGACWAIPVVVGEKYYIKAYGRNQAAALYVITGSNNIVLAKVDVGNTKDDELIVNIEQNGYLYINDMEYTTEPGSVDKLITVPNTGIKARLTKAEGDITSEVERAELAEGQLGHRIDGIKEEINITEEVIYNSTNINLNAGHYYNGSGKSEGETGVPTLTTSQRMDCAVVTIQAGRSFVLNNYLDNPGAAAVVFMLVRKSDNYIISKVTNNDGNPYTSTVLEADCDIYINVSNGGGDYPDRRGNLQLKVIKTTPIKNQVLNNTEKIGQKPDKPLYGKTVILCGDSQINQSHSAFESLVADKTGANVLKCGFSGCRMSWRSSDGSSPYDAFSMVNVADCLVSGNYTSMDTALENVESTYQSLYTPSVNALKTLTPTIIGDGDGFIMTIAYGSNDYSGGNALGQAELLDKQTVLGAMQYAIKELLTAYPKLQLIFVGLPYRVYEYEIIDGQKVVTSDSDTYIKTIGGVTYHRYDYSDAILENSAKNHLPSFDMYRRCERTKYNAFVIGGDGTHPTSEYGGKLQGELYMKLLMTF